MSFKLKSLKCAFGYDYADVFGYRVNATGISIPPKRLELFKNLNPLSDAKTLLTNISSLNYYRTIIKYFSKYAAILMPLTQKGKFVWDSDADCAWKGLIGALKNPVQIIRL